MAQGECLASIAKQHGFATWKALYDHPDNAELKKKRQNPNVLHPGDRVVIPDKEAKEVECATGKVHSFKVKQPTSVVRITLKNAAGEALADKRYEIVVNGQTLSGTTDGSGKLEHAVPDDATSGELRVWPGGAFHGPLTFPLKIGHLDPHDEITGIQSRLKNLGFNPGPVDGILGDRTRRALRAFQAKNQLRVTGEADDATKAKLGEAHGS